MLGVLAAIACLGTAVPATAHQGHLAGSAGIAEEIGNHAEPAREGLFRVRVGGGESMLTHGLDPAPEAGKRIAGGVFAPGAAERAPVCAEDYHQHVLVAHLATAPDRAADVAESVRGAIRRMNWVLNQDALENGGVTADYKVLCDPAGQIRVDSFASPTPEFEDVIRSAKAAGFDRPNADYTIFFDSLGPGGGCGIGSFRGDESLSASNKSNTGGGYAVSYQPCWFGTTPMHENAHNQGAVQYSAPQGTGTGGHCAQGYDVLCYAPDGGDRNQAGLTISCTDRPHFDCGGDDYFDPAPEPGEYLEGHWNLGSPLNRFIAFGGGQDSSGDQYEPSVTSCGGCVDRLRLGARVRGLAGGEEMKVYRLRVPRGSRALRVTMAGSGSAALYLRRGVAPEHDTWDCVSRRAGASQRCGIARPSPGAWFVGIGGRGGMTGAQPVEFELRADATR